jgi:hypothetical protein
LLKKEICRVISNHPALPESNGTGNHNFIFVKYAANTEGVLGFVFGAVRNFVVKWAKAFRPVTVCGSTHIADRETEYLSQGLFRLFLICHA